MAQASSSEDDFIDKVRREWKRTYPEIDTSPVEVMGRISRISSQSLHQLDRALAPSGVSRAEFDVMSALARSDRPLRASEVTAVTMFSGAATTKHADRLAKLGLVERQRFERDGRVVLLTLTEAGRALVEAEFPRRVERDRQLLSGLDANEQTQLTALLKRISINIDAGLWD
ncbi:MarR family winged helix-turn-helix transcriptional regulator [Rhodococcus sp. ARC_M6]|uniref:MarR family winged helix-turn-helix transcriptional regulator n=1 Tax=Rhodococcus sp. ARC_M6 TaxID=2928852 RepID=UPI001FB40072|nr:MarR family transcriptional regulator [Rhodococcus sp. ARC_M6]MCJ0906420.1 MarR family transcriptional regulator [Rhodococcus sp. ARC_M6]